MTSTKNSVGLLLQIVGLVIIGINLIRALNSLDFVDGSLAFDIFLQGVIFGVLFIGFGEVIKLLQGLFNQREPEIVPAETADSKPGNLEKRPNRKVTPESEARIREFYAAQNLQVDGIEAAPYGGYYIVNRQNERDIIDLYGFKPEVLSEAEISKHPHLKNLR